jgi:hypothetical protein
MKTLIALVAFIAGLATSAVAGDVYVNGYTRSDGTYVPGHHRSAPDASVNNNWSTSPNVNPYTGQMGTRSPTFTVPAPAPPPAPGFGGIPTTPGFGGVGTQPTFNPYNRR